MNEPNNRDYYATRAATAREMAEQAADPSIAAIHADFARRYDELAAEMESEDRPRLRIVQAA